MALIVPGQDPLFELGDGMCQRWQGGRHTYRPSHPGGYIDLRGYEVRSLDDDTTPKAFVTTHHYSRSYVNAVHRFGLFRDGELVGVAVYSTPGGGNKVLTCVLPELRPSVESVELGRLVLAQDVAGNGESWFLARCHEMLAARGVVGVVSFSDPVPRRLPDGTLIMPGHVGIIYQAMNALYTGRAWARSVWLLPDGTVMNGVALQKIRQRKRGHAYAERILTGWGMRPMRDGEDPKAWLREAKTACQVRTYRHPGNHEYVFLLGPRNVRRGVKVAKATVGRYPKTVEARELVAA